MKNIQSIADYLEKAEIRFQQSYNLHIKPGTHVDKKNLETIAQQVAADLPGDMKMEDVEDLIYHMNCWHTLIVYRISTFCKFLSRVKQLYAQRINPV